MFMQINRISSGKNERIEIIKNNNTLLTIAPYYGAKLLQLQLHDGVENHEVLWPILADDLESNAWFKQSILFPYPNRLEDGKYTFEGKSYQWPINQPETNNQLHGMVFNHPFDVVRADVSESVATVELKHAYDGALEYYPFAYDLHVTYTLSTSGLEVRFKVVNTGSGNLPFGLGWHPYFQIDKLPVKEYVIEAHDLEAIPLSERSLPTGERFDLGNCSLDLAEQVLDNAYEIRSLPNSCTLDVKSGLSLSISGSESMNFLQIFTPPGGESVAIEPMTANVNAFNNGNGTKILGAGESFTCEVNLTLTVKK